VAVPILPSGDVDETTLQWTFDAENVWGSMYSDLIIGSDGPNLLGGNPGDDIVAGLGGNDVVVGNAGDDLLDGGAGNDVLAGGPGDDQLIDEEGRDIAVFAGSHASYRIVRLGDTWQVIDEGGSDGADDLIAIERLFFADSFVAVDLDGAAGNTAKLIGAIFGEQYLIPEFVGIGISFFDAGWSMQQVAQLALNTDLYVQLAGSRSNADFVQLVYENVVGFAPSASEQAYYQGFLDRGDMTQAQLAVMAAETAENALSIDLIGLSSTGIEFIPFGG
jgi:Ca2+-binding RTX toxin-like protein